MANPFEQTDDVYMVLVNDEGQYSLWPAFIQVPEGWKVALGESTRGACLDYIEAMWKDMRPLSLQKRGTADVI
ncbi:MbtH family protein [Paenibacillus woosongensis]|uniref:MbtH family protein n=1 Tax=Paenibacillus woosongensis TaxID=307580 RepID=A0AA95IE85_9BACL|nr:MbtH family protein [Paenibacillus woosongensis]WHX50988.1 MbtH family protein [Paenibacillus woosongensis]